MLTLVALGSILFTQYLINEIQDKERSSVELWAKAMEYNSRQHNTETRDELFAMAEEIENAPLIPDYTKQRWLQTLQRADSDLANASLDFVASELIIKNRFEIPSIVTDANGEILHHRNIDERRLSTNLVTQYASLNDPIMITLDGGNGDQIQSIYYGESAVITILKYFPYVQFGLLALFLGIGYLAMSSIKKNEQSNLWVGMAKEAAHQLGTPLSSLYGWIELLKESTDKNTLNIVHELHNDVERIQVVTQRFNKIGSSPELHRQRIQPIIEKISEYLTKRLPSIGKLVELRTDIKEDVKLNINSELFTWAIENLVKNAMDAIDTSSGRANIVGIKAYQSVDVYCIEISDTGKGIEKKFLTEIFNPGFSTKVRGWGLGLSLTKRIIEDYHKGKIVVVNSNQEQGTTFRIEIPIE